ncbi:MAG: NAD(P)/FAD-dependent oxidoreductase [Clostridiales bacterium]|nr:NAD(P)/FAD-dependent oxidoreductase [Clostridiales bacterium]
MERADVVIVGGGASGLMAAIAAAEAGASVVLLEAGARLGRKIAASGNGRCNFTHRGLDPVHYYSHTPYALSPALARFSDEDAVEFFTNLGLPPYIDDRDRVYPYARKAGMVADALRLWAAHRGVVLRTDHRVTGISGGYGAFQVDSPAGPVAFDLAHAVGERLEGKNIRLHLDLFPDLPAERMEAHLALRMDRLGWQPVAAFTAGLLPKPLGLVLMRRLYAGKMTDGAAALPADMPQAFTALAKNYPLAVTGLRPYQDAQVTAGGIDLADFDPETLMSWLVPGLFACGEVLDVTGDCGGYNLQWAWASGRLAGRSAAAFAG